MGSEPFFTNGALSLRSTAGLFMDETFHQQPWPVLDKDDADLMKEIQRLPTVRAVGDPYAADGSFAASIALLPPGLRAMAATHWLDISLILDSITWHSATSVSRNL